MEDKIFSVGIDIGTSTTQIIFSKFVIENKASVTSIPKISITCKQIVYKSSLYETPLITENTIDENAIKNIIVKEYDKASFRPEDISTGAVIITGETARKENAQKVLNAISGLAGDFVVATAGSEIEGIIAGKGSGTAELSKKNSKIIANLDIGGGTTNIAVFHSGTCIATSCLDIGGRLIRFNKNKKITYIAPKILNLCKNNNISLNISETVSYEKIYKICLIMAKILLEVIDMKIQTKKDVDLLITDHVLNFEKYAYDKISLLTFSGGVGEFIYNDEKEDFPYDDIGVVLSRAIKEIFNKNKKDILKPKETIHATVIGAGMYSTEISGSTIVFTKDLFPIKNVPIIKVSPHEELLTPEEFTEKIKPFLRNYEAHDGSNLVALALRGEANVKYKNIKSYVDKIILAMKPIILSKNPLIVILEHDMGMVLGQSLMLEIPKKDIVCLDSINCELGDYIDIGKPLMSGRVLPVVVKTLMFS